MKTLLLTLTATIGLTMTAIDSHAQPTETETESHSRANSQGGMDTITRTRDVGPPPPQQPPLAMYDWAMDSSNPLIAVNDPTKFGHPKPKPVWNHDGQAFAIYAPRSFHGSHEYAYAYCTQYYKNVKSGKWREFKNGDD